MGKVVKYTGSKLLGEELRRLRGARSLDDIVEMSKLGPLTSRIHPVSAPSLSQIENGITMPSTEVLYTLSVLYNQSPARLLHLVVEERLAKTENLPGTADETRARMQQALSSTQWYEALALAIHGGRLATSESDRLLWQASRAFAMRRLGLRQDAILLLMEVSSSPVFESQHRYIAHVYLADTLAEAGFIDVACDQAARAEATLGATPNPGALARVLRTRARLGILESSYGLVSDAARMHDVQHWITRIRALEAPQTLDQDLSCRLLSAITFEYLGNELVAARDYEAIAQECRKVDEPVLETMANGMLGSLRRKQGRLAEARRVLERAENSAVAQRLYDEAFSVYFELYLVSQAAADGRSALPLKRCLRYWPLLQSRTPHVLAFEQLLREGRVR